MKKPIYILRSFVPGYAPRFVSQHASQRAAARALFERLRDLRRNPPRVWNDATQQWDVRMPTFDVFEA